MTPNRPLNFSRQWVEPGPPQTLYFNIKGAQLCIYTRQHVHPAHRRVITSGRVYFYPGTFSATQPVCYFDTLVYRYSEPTVLLRITSCNKEVHKTTGWTEATAVSAAIRYMTEGVLPTRRKAYYYVTSHS